MCEGDRSLKTLQLHFPHTRRSRRLNIKLRNAEGGLFPQELLVEGVSSKSLSCYNRSDQAYTNFQTIQLTMVIVCGVNRHWPS